MTASTEKYEQTIEFLKSTDDIFAIKYDQVVELIKKSRTPEGANIEVTIEGVSPMPEDKEGYPVSKNVLTRITITDGKTVTIFSVLNISKETLRLKNYTTIKLAKIEKTKKRLIGKKRDVYACRIAKIDDYHMYYGEEEGAIVSTLHKEFPIEIDPLLEIAEIGTSYTV